MLLVRADTDGLRSPLCATQAEVVEIGVYDWVVLWLVYLVIFMVNAGVQHWTRQEGDVDSLIPIYVVIALFMFLQVFQFVSRAPS